MLDPLPPQTRQTLDGIPALIDKAFPLPARFRSALPQNTAELSRLLTSGRGERGLSYLGRPHLLSAYLRFFLPWNLYRLCRLLPALDIPAAVCERITDLGCGPLTAAAALWISRPDLRSLPLEWHCIDHSGPALDAGRIFFTALAGADSPWKIHTVKGSIAAAEGPAKQSTLVCAINVFNEMYGDISRAHAADMSRNAEKSVRLLESHAAADSRFLIVEPGIPRSGAFISRLRAAFLERGRKPLAPCTHSGECPFPAGAHRWCHFAFDTADAPAALRRLSQAAHLPKERAVLSFLFAGPPGVDTAAGVRIISDAFPLPQNRSGRYGCSERGLVLLTGEKNAIARVSSGALSGATVKNDQRDPKSGALIIDRLSLWNPLF